MVLADIYARGETTLFAAVGHETGRQLPGRPAARGLSTVANPSGIARLPGMAVESHQVNIETHGDNHVVNITDDVARCIESGRIRDGVITVFVIGSTAALTTTEYEPGLAKHDLKVAFEKIAPKDGRYLHEETWHDDNGHAHVRASLLGPSLSVPIIGGRLALGTWQQIVLIDFDTRPRARRVIVQALGE